MIDFFEFFGFFCKVKFEDKVIIVSWLIDFYEEVVDEDICGVEMEWV